MEQAKAEGNEFVIIKLGEAYNVDEYFEEHMTAALEAGLGSRCIILAMHIQKPQQYKKQNG